MFRLNRKSIFGMLLITIMVIFTVISCDDDSDDNDVVKPTLKIAALLATTGNSASFGESSWAAIQLAEEDINDWLNEEENEWLVEFNLNDTEGNSSFALSMLEDISNSGVDIVIGPTTSSEAASIRENANLSDVLLVSPSSVAISIAIPDDNLYRFATDDIHQAEAMAAMLEDDEVDILVSFTRGDIWGDDLLSATTTAFQGSGAVVEGVRYDIDTDDFNEYLDLLEEDVAELIGDYPPETNIAIYALTFGEITSIFEQIDDRQVLLDVQWYGSSAAAKNANLVTSAEAAGVAAMVGFPCSTFGEYESEESSELKIRLETKLGREAESYAFAAYDAAWVAVKSYYGVDRDTLQFATLKSNFEETCETYIGTSGPVSLNAAGDREFGNYDFWSVRISGDSYEWYKSALYEIDPETLDGTLIRY